MLHTQHMEDQVLPSAKDLEDQLEKIRDLESRLTFRLSILSKVMDQQAQGMLEGTGLTLTAYRIMNVAGTFGSLSISEISRICATDRAQISRTATDLEKRGLIAFSDDPSSRRKKNVSLTKEGDRLLDQVRPDFLSRNQKIDAILGPERRAALIDAINLLTDNATS